MALYDMRTSPNAARRGTSLIELMLVITIIGLTSLIALRQAQQMLDRLATRDAVRSAAGILSRAREDAVAQHTPVSVRIDTGAATLELRSRYGPHARASLRSTHGVSITTTRDSITYDVRGLGYGAANLTLVAKRGRSADTLVVSRLGRLRY